MTDQELICDARDHIANRYDTDYKLLIRCFEAVLDRFSALQAENAELRIALSRVEAERDAAISDVPHDCEHCKHAIGSGACKLLPDGDQFSPDYTDGFDRDGNCDHWEWRGAQGEG